MRVGNPGPVAAVDVTLGHVEEQIEHAAAAGNAREFLRKGRANALEGVERREERLEQVARVGHGLTHSGAGPI